MGSGLSFRSPRNDRGEQSSSTASELHAGSAAHGVDVELVAAEVVEPGVLIFGAQEDVLRQGEVKTRAGREADRDRGFRDIARDAGADDAGLEVVRIEARIAVSVDRPGREGLVGEPSVVSRL